MNAPPSVPLFAADRPHSKCSRRFFHFQFLLIGKAFTEPRVQRVVLLIQKMFNYDLSFIGWYIGSLVTFGLIGIYYYTPYKLSCDTEVYRIISGKLGSNIKFGRKPVIYPVMNQSYYSRKAPR